MSDSIANEAPDTERRDGTTRASFLKRAGVGGVAVLGGGAILGKVATPAWARDAKEGVNELDVLNYALTLEYLEASFYTQALGGGGGATGLPTLQAKFSQGAITGSKAFAGFNGRVRSSAYGYLSTIRDHEVEHVTFLRNALKTSAVGPATYNFDAALKSVGSFLQTALVLENTGVKAYDGAIRYIDTPAFVQAGATIATVEARHAAYLNLINRTSPFPTAFDATLKPSEVLAAARGFFRTIPMEVVALFGRLP